MWGGLGVGFVLCNVFFMKGVISQLSGIIFHGKQCVDDHLLCDFPTGEDGLEVLERDDEVFFI